ncbi:MAG: FixH family protein [Ktedonobacteraceae bacterium]|nr:FixH family protein [Chloroflexota bacterium]
MRRGLLAVALGISFLILMTWLGTIVANIVPHRATAQMQSAQVGPYSVTLQVNPNPPFITQPATLSVQVLFSASQQPVTGATVVLESNMETMDMGTERAPAPDQGKGIYRASVQFSMSGFWKVQVLISRPGTPPARAAFYVTAQ